MFLVMISHMTSDSLSARADLMIRLFDQAPMKHTFGMVLSYDESGNARLDMPHQVDFRNGIQDTHGGVIATLLDNAGWFTAAMQYENWVNTSEITVRLHEPANQEDLFALGHIVRAGRRLCVAGMEVRSTSGRLVATGTGTFVVSSKPISLS